MYITMLLPLAQALLVNLLLEMTEYKQLSADNTTYERKIPTREMQEKLNSQTYNYL